MLPDLERALQELNIDRNNHFALSHAVETRRYRMIL